MKWYDWVVFLFLWAKSRVEQIYIVSCETSLCNVNFRKAVIFYLVS